MGNFAIEAIIKEMNRLKFEKQRAIDRFDGLIQECESSIYLLTGKNHQEVEREMQFDDENPDYIKQSIEEI